jgi:hypothetical protein
MEERMKEDTIHGCGFDQENLTKIWALARRGFSDPESASELVFQRDPERAVRSTSIQALFDEVSETKLTNLELTASETNPEQRFVQLRIGPGRGVTLIVKAEDHTWALGRFAELMEALDATRGRLGRIIYRPPTITSSVRRTAIERSLKPIVILASYIGGTITMVFGVLFTLSLGTEIYRSIANIPQGDTESSSNPFATVAFGVIAALYILGWSYRNLVFLRPKVVVRRRSRPWLQVIPILVSMGMLVVSIGALAVAIATRK